MEVGKSKIFRVAGRLDTQGCWWQSSSSKASWQRPRTGNEAYDICRWSSREFPLAQRGAFFFFFLGLQLIGLGSLTLQRAITSLKIHQFKCQSHPKTSAKLICEIITPPFCSCGYNINTCIHLFVTSINTKYILHIYGKLIFNIGAKTI